MHTQADFYFKKAYVSGNVIEEYSYRNPIYCVKFLRKHSNLGLSVEATPSERTEFAKKRVKKAIRRLVNCNPALNKFLTLTFKDNVVDLKQANYQFKLFRGRLEYLTGKKLAYIAIPEFQARGAVHYHILMDYPFIAWKAYMKAWGRGGAYIQRVRNTNATANYVSSYVSRQDWADLRFYKQKAYFCSRFLARCVLYVDNLLDDYYSSVKIKLVKTFSYFSRFVGFVDLKFYQLVE